MNLDLNLIALSFLAPHFSPRRINFQLRGLTPEEFFSGKAWRELPLDEDFYLKVKSLDWKEVEKTQKWCQEKGIKVLGRSSPSYPECLNRLEDPPPVIYLWGGEIFYEKNIAVVGTRKPTNYGKEVAFRISADLSRAGLGIVSGLARGLDSVAHQAALETGGRTIAVLGSGFKKIYPPENKKLAEKIILNGCLISEYPPETSPNQWHFPSRNRIIAALSRGVLVIEAGEGSGALITCDFALDMGIEVYVVPGSVFSPSSRGCHQLIKDGAKLVESAQDILEDFGLTLFPEEKKEEKLTFEERKILETLSSEPLPLEDILAQVDLGTGTVLASLSLLEVKGLIRSLPGNLFVRR
ncbi:MAG: DNA-processing protein DprA [Caldiserica bacterium]|nr:DNA-processing protein DprA [Caldisericota bacterium]MDH7562890.1 DNA-processing protein DprA [Caldisericota bacterium]